MPLPRPPSRRPSRPTRGRRPALALLASLAALAVFGCSAERERPFGGGGAHPLGWADVDSEAFHGSWLRDHGYPLGDCRTCHGDDGGGGPVGVACASGGCHEREGGVGFCGTCHGSENGPQPTSGSHAAHAGFCLECHRVPDALDAEGHLDGRVDVRFAGLARPPQGAATWSVAEARCDNVYCHGSGAPRWYQPAPLDCASCHQAPPPSHARFARVAGLDRCSSCHGAAAGATGHVDGTVTLALAQVGCDGCHGTGAQGMPAPALDGATDRTAPGVGAHARHVDLGLGDRIGRAVPCASCHVVPESITAPGHLDDSAPADVRLPPGGSYDPATGQCSVWCHWDDAAAPPPRWTDTSGAARGCGSCHEFPPTKTRVGTPHPPAAPELGVCLGCHPFAVDTHVDGQVTLW